MRLRHSGRSLRRSSTWSGRCDIRKSFRPRTGRIIRKPSGRTLFIDTVDRESAGTILDHLGRSDASMRVVQLRVLGGAMARIPRDATAFAHRDSRMLAVVAAFYDGPEDRPQRVAWTEGVAGALDQGRSGAYVGFMMDDGEASVRSVYPVATWNRLASVKARYDPNNLFRLNHNVPPGG